jgi:hypothetical protein
MLGHSPSWTGHVVWHVEEMAQVRDERPPDGINVSA